MTLGGPGEGINAPYDYLVFNSIGTGGAPQTAPAEFTANGTAYNPTGLTNDFELTIGGPGDGSQADLVAADANLSLAYWSPEAAGGEGGYVAVPSAFNYGGETGETSNGGTITWSDLPAGPSGISPYAVMRTGPSLLEGLWNVSGPEGSYPVTIDSSPSNAFEVVTPQVSTPWTDLSSSLLVHPSLRADYMEAYDPALSAVVLFGGVSVAQPTGMNDTWEFASGQWTNVTGAVAPPPRVGGGLVYDAAGGYLVLFGGESTDFTEYSPTIYGDTWVFNSTGWHELRTLGAPSPRTDFAMTYDAASTEVVLFGGGVRSSTTGLWSLFHDTWTFRGGQWTNITATAGIAPSGRVRAGLVYDPVIGAALLVGGAGTGDPGISYEGVTCTLSFPDEWTFAAGRWSELSPSGDVPPPGTGSLWFDTGTSTVYYYESADNLTASGGGCDPLAGDVWSYASGVWQLVISGSAPASPIPRFQATVVEDPADHLDLLFGGQRGFEGEFLPDTWAFDPNVSAPLDQPYIVPEPTIGPTITTDTFWLAPGNYSLETELSDFAPTVTPLSVSGPVTVAPSLPSDPALGIYTPLWAWSNSQLSAIASSGNGTPSDPFVLENVQPGPIGPTFGLYNDFGDLLYPGLFLLDTNATTELLDPPTFAIDTNDWQMPGPNLVTSQSPMFWFWNVSGVALVGGVGVGADEWLLSGLAPYAITFYDSSHNLVAGNNFTAPYGSILFAAGPRYGPFTGPGGNNTIWGNQFLRIHISQGLMGVVETESNDLVYNNYFDTYYTACEPGDPALPNDCWPLYPFTNQTLNDSWNITQQPASNVRYAAGFPTIPLSGSIEGSNLQGGNYWWNYGVAPNSLDSLPYDEKVVTATGIVPWISPGGDYVPQVGGHSVTFIESGLPARQLAEYGWTVAVAGTSEHSTNLSIYFPDIWVGEPILVTGPAGFRTNVSGTVGAPLVVMWYVEFTKGSTLTLSFGEKGLARGQPWCLQVDGFPQCSTSTSLKFLDLAPGNYSYAVASPTAGQNITGRLGTTVLGPAGELTLKGSVKVVLTFHYSYSVTFTESGLPSSASWSVTIQGRKETGTAGQPIVFFLTNGTYAYRLGVEPGFRAFGTPAKIHLNGTATSVQVRFVTR